MAELLDRIRVEISTRLTELRPLVDEHRRLEAALRALSEPTSGAPAPPPVSSPVQATPRAGAKARTSPGKRAPRGANREAVLRAVSDRPGATSAELAALSGVERNTLNGLLARLVKAGELQARQLPTRRTGYALVDAGPAAPAAAAPGGRSADEASALPADGAAE